MLCLLQQCFYLTDQVIRIWKQSQTVQPVLSSADVDKAVAFLKSGATIAFEAENDALKSITLTDCNFAVEQLGFDKSGTLTGSVNGSIDVGQSRLTGKASVSPSSVFVSSAGVGFSGCGVEATGVSVGGFGVSDGTSVGVGVWV